VPYIAIPGGTKRASSGISKRTTIRMRLLILHLSALTLGILLMLVWVLTPLSSSNLLYEDGNVFCWNPHQSGETRKITLYFPSWLRNRPRSQARIVFEMPSSITVKGSSLLASRRCSL